MMPDREALTLTICLDSRSTAAMRMRFPIAAAGHHPPFGPQVELPLERPLHLDCCHSVSPLSVLPKVRQEGRARSRVVAGGGAQPLDKMVHFVFSSLTYPLSDFGRQPTDSRQQTAINRR